jgi:hypothetical protein
MRADPGNQIKYSTLFSNNINQKYYPTTVFIYFVENKIPSELKYDYPCSKPQSVSILADTENIQNENFNQSPAGYLRFF